MTNNPLCETHVTVDGGSSPYIQLVADLIRDIGIVKCCIGEMAAGCQLMEESMSLYEWRPASDADSNDVTRVQQPIQVARVSEAKVEVRVRVKGWVRVRVKRG